MANLKLYETFANSGIIAWASSFAQMSLIERTFAQPMIPGHHGGVEKLSAQATLQDSYPAYASNSPTNCF